MGICNTKRVLCLLAVVWLGIMCYLWFPDKFPIHNLLKEKNSFPDKGILQAEAFQMARFNKSKLAQADVVHVCITSDENTIGGMIALINSIDQNTKHPVMFHLLVDAESVVHLRTWIENTRLHDIMYEIKPFPYNLVDGKVKVRGNRQELARPLNYARYYIPQLFPDLSGRIIFIDDDCIVQGDLYELFNVKLKPDHWAVFAEDCTGSAKRVTLMKNVYADYIDFKNKHVQMLDINPTACSFNTGVYVTDIDIWRKHNITQKLEYWLTLNTKEEVYGSERGGGGSQPPMMLVFHNKYTSMDPIWHVRYLGWTKGTSYTSSFLSQAKLLHWNGQFKPWGRVSQHSEIWNKYFIEDPLGKFAPIRKS
ncbi:glycosyltransferase 8 domain-containing protein 1-like [Ruditapes philippinarum]|uniref:glycosyltransferase 8 domain-containing protein 1-like n=1 Tax=Ruditapes philippinarum TaxID=129788 RepID=UPI00295B7717|nr:glycosyltransferase 8 domain-containing protein 1-like [Ruditapes philippinarum]